MGQRRESIALLRAEILFLEAEPASIKRADFAYQNSGGSNLRLVKSHFYHFYIRPPGEARGEVEFERAFQRYLAQRRARNHVVATRMRKRLNAVRRKIIVGRVENFLLSVLSGKARVDVRGLMKFVVFIEKRRQFRSRDMQRLSQAAIVSRVRRFLLNVVSGEVGVKLGDLMEFIESIEDRRHFQSDNMQNLFTRVYAFISGEDDDVE